MRISIDGRAASIYRGTGIGTYTYQLINNLNNIDKNNSYLIFSEENAFTEQISFNRNFKFSQISFNEKTSFWETVKVPNILTDETIDLYHVPQNGVGLPFNTNCKNIITLHDIIPLKMPETVSNRYLKIFNEDLPKILDNCQGIITVSNFSKDDIASSFNISKDKIYVTHLAAEDIYCPLNKFICRNIIEKRYDIYDKFILYVGGLSPRKNILGLIEAYSLLPNLIKDQYKLVITGRKGISYNKYQKRCEELNVDSSVIFTDFLPIKDLSLFYNVAEVLIYPSFYEGFGLPPLEAMACGTPVIASNSTSLPEVCSDSALLIDPYNIYELKDSIENLLTDSRLQLKLIQKGLARSSKFSWNNTAIQTINAYQSTMEN